MPRSPPEMRTVRPFAAGAAGCGSPTGSGFRGRFRRSFLHRLLFRLRGPGCLVLIAQVKGQFKFIIVQESALLPFVLCLQKNPAGRKVPPSTAPMGCALLLFPVKAGPAASPLVCASGFDKLPLNNIAQFGEKRKWEPPSFHAVPTFFHVLRGSRAVSSGALRPAAPAAGGKTPAAAPAPPPPAGRVPPPDGG